MSKPIEIDLTNQGDRSEGGALPSARAASLRPQPPSASSQSGIPNAVLRSPEEIWSEACAGREGYCSSDLRAATKAAILTAQLDALAFASALAPFIRLPPDYRWSDSNFGKFQFGAERLAEAIQAVAVATMGAALASGIEAPSGGETHSGSTVGESPAPEGGDAHD